MSKITWNIRTIMKNNDIFIKFVKRWLTTIENYNLTKIEENKLKAVFWGTNFTTDDILKGIKEKNQKILKKIEENLPLNLQKQILGKLNYA